MEPRICFWYAYLEEDEETKKVKEEAAASQKRWEALIASASAEFDLEDSPLDIAVKDLKLGNMVRALRISFKQPLRCANWRLFVRFLSQ